MKVAELLGSSDEYLDEIFLTRDGSEVEVLVEGRKWVSGRFDRNLGIDQPHHLAGVTLRPGQKAPQEHAHVFGRKGEELGVVNFDGTSSHGSKFRVPDADADVLRKRGYAIPLSNLVEWTRWSIQAKVLLLG